MSRSPQTDRRSKPQRRRARPLLEFLVTSAARSAGGILEHAREKHALWKRDPYHFHLPGSRSGATAVWSRSWSWSWSGSASCTVLAESAAITTDSGVLVNELLETNVPGFLPPATSRAGPTRTRGGIRVEHLDRSAAPGPNIGPTSRARLFLFDESFIKQEASFIR